MAKSKSKKKTEEKPSDFLGITLLDVMNFILEKGVESFNSEGKTDDERYISFISDVFVKFLSEYGYKYRGADFQEPDYLKREEFRLNRDLIKDKRVLRFIEMDDSYESLYKLILNSFRKIKKRAGGIITPGIIDQFNILVKDIQSIVSKDSTGKIQESQSMPSFMEFKKNLDQKKVDYVTDEAEESKDDDFYSYNEFISALETIDSTEKPKKSPQVFDSESPKDLEKVNLIIGRFQPFHNGHLKMAKFLKEKNGLPSIVAVVHPGHNKSGSSPLPETLVSKSLESVCKENPGLFLGYFISPRGLLGPIYGRSKQLGYLPHLIGAGEDRLESYKKQEDYLKKAGGDFPDEVQIVETPRSGSSTKIRELLDAEDFISFKRLVPQSIAAFYPQMVSALKGTSVNESEQEINRENEQPIQEVENITESAK
jgi:cytidyltransferase-like protein